MLTFSPELLAQWTGGRWTAAPRQALTGFTMDSRQLRPGQVFVAIKTDQRDGHDFLGGAVAAGASAALVARANPELTLPQLVVTDPLLAFQTIAREHRRTFRGPVIGISGSAGKTSTKKLLTSLLGGGDAVLATDGNLNNHLGVPLTLTRLDSAVHQFAVVEAGISAPGEMTTLAGMIEPDIAIITLVAPAHLHELGGLEGVANEKSRLPAAISAAGVAIFPRQCAEFTAFHDLTVRTMIIEPADVLRPSDPPKDKVFFAVTHRGDTTAISLAYGLPPPLMFTLPRVSDGMAQNAALAICAALWLGVARELVQARLSEWKPASLRGEVRRENGRLLYLDCYNANPASMDDALDAFYAIAPVTEPRLYVLGGMEELGANAEAFHTTLGSNLAIRPQDFVFVIGTYAHAVRNAAVEKGVRSDQIEVVTSLEVVAARLETFQGAVFVKGSRRYQLEKALAHVASLEAVHA